MRQNLSTVYCLLGRPVAASSCLSDFETNRRRLMECRLRLNSVETSISSWTEHISSVVVVIAVLLVVVMVIECS